MQDGTTSKKVFLVGESEGQIHNSIPACAREKTGSRIDD